jgi:hypothetical protein|tara:strand:- start:300 stop:698 length:399 start_codon:yes stop_codon:yes gene_type:complete
MIKKILIGIAVLYVLVVVGFESMLGYTQPENQGTLVITTFDDGEPHDRVVSRIHIDDELYVAVNHWPRLWYWQLLDEPVVRIRYGDTDDLFRAVPVEGDQAIQRVDDARPLSLQFRILTGFPPRHFVQLVKV